MVFRWGRWGDWELLARIPDHSLTVFDKGFFSAAILVGLTVTGENRHVLIPAKAHTKWKVLSGTPEDAVVRMKVSREARVKHPELPVTWDLVRLEMAKAALEAKA